MAITDLETQILEDVKGAMRSGDHVKRDTLRMLIAALKNERIAKGEDLDHATVETVIRRGVKSRKDSSQKYREVDRPEHADKEDAEIVVLEAYLPQMMDEAATLAAVDAVIAETGASGKGDIGKVMKGVMAKHKGLVEGKLVNRLASERLG